MIAIDPPVRFLIFSLAPKGPSTHAPTRRRAVPAPGGAMPLPGRCCFVLAHRRDRAGRLLFLDGGGPRLRRRGQGSWRRPQRRKVSRPRMALASSTSSATATPRGRHANSSSASAQPSPSITSARASAFDASACSASRMRSWSPSVADKCCLRSGLSAGPRGCTAARGRQPAAVEHVDAMADHPAGVRTAVRAAAVAAAVLIPSGVS